LRVVTYNVNGIRALARKGGVERLQELAADVICLQEVRADPKQFEVAAAAVAVAAIFAPCETKGRNGVAILTNHEVIRSSTNLPGFEDDGRWVQALLATPWGPTWFVSAYVPKGYVGDLRQQYKLAFLEQMTKRMTELLRDTGADSGRVVITGDLNIAHQDLDLKNWRGRRGKSGVLPEERAVLDHWQDQGWSDVGRRLAGDVAGPYSWWSQRGRAFDRDSGWRIDYVWAAPELAAKATAHKIDRPPAWNSRWSDHAAVIVDFEHESGPRR
jgi:exodeoxyribonuclease-3